MVPLDEVGTASDSDRVNVFSHHIGSLICDPVAIAPGTDLMTATLAQSSASDYNASLSIDLKL
jgi:hypothetical protein